MRPEFATSNPDLGYGAPRPRQFQVLWKSSLAVTTVVLIFYAWQCGSALTRGRGLANDAVRRFHQELNGERYEQIAKEADEGFLETGKDKEFVNLLEGVHAKLGDASKESLSHMTVNTGTDGTFLTAEYDTEFARGSAEETFTWIKRSGELKLYSYDVRSNGLLLK